MPAAASDIRNTALPLPAPPAAGGGISIFELLPEAPLGIPLLAWVGGAIWLAIVVLMFK